MCVILPTGEFELEPGGGPVTPALTTGTGHGPVVAAVVGIAVAVDVGVAVGVAVAEAVAVAVGFAVALATDDGAADGDADPPAAGEAELVGAEEPAALALAFGDGEPTDASGTGAEEPIVAPLLQPATNNKRRAARDARPKNTITVSV